MSRRGTISNIESNDREMRPIRLRKYPHLFLIVCEDGKTEPYYFNLLKKDIPDETIFLKAVGTGRNSVGVVKQAIIEKDRLSQEAKKEIDEVWAVFDKDDADKTKGNTERFHDAFRIAQENSIKVAYSNEVFELWALLHFVEVDYPGALPRADIYQNLERAIRMIESYDDFCYEHGKTVVIDILNNVGDESSAINRAEILLANHNKEKKTHPIDANPSTTVHLLIKQLRMLIEFYSPLPEV